MYASKVAMECGDTESAFNIYWFSDTYAWIGGRVSLQVLVRDIERHYASCRAYKNTAIGDGLLFLATNLRKLVDTDDKHFAWLDGIDCGFANREEGKKDRGASVKSNRNSILLESHFLLGEMAEALNCTRRLQNVAKDSAGLATVPRVQYYRGLVLLFFARDGRGSKKNLRESKAIIAELKKWMENGHVNCAHMVCLLEAELARHMKQFDTAKKLYRDAIRMATSMQHTHDIGISNQYAAQFFLENEDRSRAAHHVRQAISGFSEWGASELVRRLREKHSILLADVDVTAYQSAAFSLHE